jgi:hypothetical protein
MIIISNALDDSSSGLVIRNFIKNAKSNNKSVFGFFEEVSKNDSDDRIISLGGVRLINRIDKILMIMFNQSFNCKKRAKKLVNKNFNPDLIKENQVFIFVTGVNFFSMYVAHYIAKRYDNVKINVHFLDTIVSKNSWGEHLIVTKAKTQLLRKLCLYLSNSVNFSFTNFRAKEFLESILSREINARIFYSYSVVDYNYNFNSGNKSKFIFYFRGTLDKHRNSDFILDVFNECAEEFQEFDFVFQGKISASRILNEYKNVKILEFSTTTEMLEQADIFIDIDLFDVDVFIPGKFFEYIGYNKAILSISPIGSALRNLYDNDFIENSLIFATEFQKSSIKKQLINIRENIINQKNGKLRFGKVETLNELLV